MLVKNCCTIVIGVKNIASIVVQIVLQKYVKLVLNKV